MSLIFFCWPLQENFLVMIWSSPPQCFPCRLRKPWSMCRNSLHVALNFFHCACSHHSGSCVWSLLKSGSAVAVPAKHLAAAPVALVFVDSAGSPVCPYGFNAILPLLQVCFFFQGSFTHRIWWHWNITKSGWPHTSFFLIRLSVVCTFTKSVPAHLPHCESDMLGMIKCGASFMQESHW